MKKFLLLTAIACTATLAAVAPAMADGPSSGSTTTETESSGINVIAAVSKSCTKPTVETPSTVTAYNGTADKTDDSIITFRCTKGTSGTVKLKTLSTGASNGGTLGAAGTTDKLVYTLTGDGTVKLGKGLTAIPANDLSTTATVKVAAGQDVTAGFTYTDTINVSISH
jgi:hypothetical protein